MNIKLKHIIIILLINVFIIGGLIWYISELNQIITNKENQILVLNQNEQALKDEMNMIADSLQNYAIRVQDLQKENEDIKTKYKVLVSKYQILWDSVKVLNQPADVDTSGDKIVITFEGKEGKIWYNGSTTYFKLTNQGIYSINVGADPIQIVSEIYLDKEDKIIRNKIFADGVLIDSASTVIDSTIYLLIQGSTIEPVTKLGFFDRLKATLSLNQKILNTNGIYTQDETNIMIGIEYQFDSFNIYGHRDLINPSIEVGVKLNPSIKQIWKAIF